MILSFLGILGDFYRWAIDFGIFYLPKASGQIKLPTIKQFLVSFFPFIIFTPFLVERKKKDFDLAVWTFFAVLGTLPRFELFHFQPALPFLAIAAGLVFEKIIKSK